jgi:DNA-binding MurR/RpiR family transcriptional regulator
MYRERIRENYEHLSKSQKRIADFLMTSHREAAFMTASRLAGVLDVDVATITRFAQRLKYPGYPELLDEVRTIVQAEMSEGFHPVEGVSDAGRAFVRTLTLSRDNVERTLGGISLEAVEKTIAALERAQRVYVLGMNTGSLLAARLVLGLQIMDVHAVVVDGDAVQAALTMRNLQAEDVVVGFGFSGYAAEVGGMLRIARAHGATTIGISGSDVSPVARSADIVLICVASSSLHIPSEVATIAVIEGIAQALALSRMDAFKRNMSAFGDFYQELAANHSHPVGSVEDSIMKLY